tara:strand:- start:8024 stop:8395 length:372 start_codon:yes stop_codon:yes gene_type:complete
VAISITPPDPFQERIYKQTALLLAGDFDVFSGPCTLYALTVINGASEYAYVKFYNAVSATATTQPEFFIAVKNGETRTITIPSGLAFTTALSMRVSDAIIGAENDGALPSGGSVQVFLHAKES